MEVLRDFCTRETFLRSVPAGESATLLGDGILDHQFLWHLGDIHRRFLMNGGHV
jgi:hypothetical protein